MIPGLYLHKKGNLYLALELRTALTDLREGDQVPFTQQDGVSASAEVTDPIAAGSAYVVYSDTAKVAHWARPMWMFGSPLRFTPVGLYLPDLGSRLALEAAVRLLRVPHTGIARDALHLLLLAQDHGLLVKDLVISGIGNAPQRDSVGIWRDELRQAQAFYWPDTAGSALLTGPRSTVLCAYDRGLVLTSDSLRKIDPPLVPVLRRYAETLAVGQPQQAQAILDRLLDD